MKSVENLSLKSDIVTVAALRNLSSIDFSMTMVNISLRLCDSGVRKIYWPRRVNISRWDTKHSTVHTQGVSAEITLIFFIIIIFTFHYYYSQREMFEWNWMVSREAYSDAISFFCGCTSPRTCEDQLWFFKGNRIFVIINLSNRIFLNALIDTTGRDI